MRMLQSSVNSFGSIAMAGYTASNKYFRILICVGDLLHTGLYELHKPELRSEEIKTYGQGSDRLYDPFSCGNFDLGSNVYILDRKFCDIYSNQADVIKYGMEIFSYTTVTYFLCGLMDLFPGALRGMGYSTVPMILSIIGTVGVRIIWIYGLFPSHRSLTFLFLSYPVSWIATIIMQVICFWFVRKKIHRTMVIAAE